MNLKQLVKNIVTEITPPAVIKAPGVIGKTLDSVLVSTLKNVRTKMKEADNYKKSVVGRSEPREKQTE